VVAIASDTELAKGTFRGAADHPYAGIIRIRFKGSAARDARPSQAFATPGQFSQYSTLDTARDQMSLEVCMTGPSSPRVLPWYRGNTAYGTPSADRA